MPRITEDTCPYCGSTDTNCHDSEYLECKVRKLHWCSGCSRHYVAVFIFSHNEKEESL
jgi:transcriptional regulator NrdR family protein